MNTFNVILNGVKNLFLLAQTQSNKLRTADCRFANKIPNAVLRLSNNLLCCVLLLLFFTGGCSAIDLLFGKQQKKLSYEQLAATYNRIILKDSLTLDVLPKIRRSEAELGSHLAGTELLSSSEDTVASLGQSKDGYKTWFNMVTFHEYSLKAIRKSFFAVNDKETSLGSRTSRSLIFDCEMVLLKDVFEQQYATESSAQIALLEYVLSTLKNDIGSLDAGTKTSGQSNQMMSVCGMLLNQTFETILRKFDSSPVLATRLNQPGGVRFDHISFNQGAIQMIIEADIVTVHIRLGALSDTI